MDLSKLKSKKPIAELLEFGILNIDKPTGPTSFNVSDFVRKSLNNALEVPNAQKLKSEKISDIRKKIGLRKTSHFGTLDPKVTGVLPIALNRACKLTGYFIGEDKEYVGIMRIHEDVSLEKVRETIKKKFLGKILQTPPVKSRVARREREREIKKFELIEKDDKDILFKTEVQGGIYIRKLIDDLGKELGVGAHMLELRRTRAGIFKEDNKEHSCINLYDFEKAVDEYKNGDEKNLKRIIIPAEEAIKKVFPVLKIKKDNLKQIFTGKPIHKKDLIKNENFKTDEIVCVFCYAKFIGMYKIIKDRYIFAKSEFVMQPLGRRI